MTNVRNFIEEQKRYERIISEYLGCEYLDNQRRGDYYDCISNSAHKIEIKFDWLSIQTGNHFLEFNQRTYENEWVPSGIEISARDADYWIVVNNDSIYILTIESVKKMLGDNDFKISSTRIGVNYNRTSQFAKGYLVPLDILQNYCLFKIMNKTKAINPKYERNN